ncbi:MAG TPA: hypothetical protein VLW65_00970 [Bryobacteraceae bacterium]|nr:hypothetical protein [Bryobacteraceae bacterium]
MPFHRVYQPGLHVSVAAVGTIFSLAPQRAHHVVTAVLYCLGPVTLFWLCDRLTGRRGYAFAVALLYSLFSPSVLLSSAVREDLGGWLLARRYQTLVHYGEGPHIGALALLPLIVWSFDHAIAGRKNAFIPISAGLLAALIVTNWTGTVGLALALVAYFLAQVDGVPAAAWVKSVVIAVLAYLLVCPWIPPSTLASVPGNAQYSDGTYFNGFRFACIAGFAAALVALHFLLKRFQVRRGSRFFLYSFLCTAFVVLGKYWVNISITPQSHRFQLELEMWFIAVVLLPVAWAWERLARWVRIALMACLAIFCMVQIVNYRKYVRLQTLPLQMENRIEYRMAKWFELHLPGRRVFAPGSVSIWMNAFADVPQMVGCCDQSVPSVEQRLAFYTIYTGQNAGAQDAEFSRVWLKAYGAAAIGVSGVKSQEFFKPFANPNKFDGVFPVLWRDGDDAIYAVPGRSTSLAHVIRPEQAVSRAPLNGLDVAPLLPYVAAIDDPSFPMPNLRWVNAHQVRIQAQVPTGQIVSVQFSYAPGWRALANGRPARLRADPLGLIIIEPQCGGDCSIDLSYDGGTEARWTRFAQLAGVALCFVWPLARRRTS